MSQGIELILNAAFSAHQNGEFDRAEKLYEEAYKISPNNLGLLMLYSALLGQKGASGRVVELLKKAVKIDSRNFFAQFNLAVAFESIGNLGKAVEHYSNAIKLDHLQDKPYINRASLYANMEKFAEAKNDYEVVISRIPGDLVYLNAYGKVLLALKEYEAAIDVFKKAILIDQSFPELHFNLANCYHDLERYDSAEAEYGWAIDLDPGYGDAYKNLGNLSWDMKKMSQAINCFEKAIAINGDKDSYTQGSFLMAKNYICDWEGYQERLKAFEADAMKGNRRLSMPGIATWVSGSGEVMRSLADQWVMQHAHQKGKEKLRKTKSGKKIKVGYFSPDFRVHALSSLLVEMLELHDHSKFDIYAFSFINSVDEMQIRIKSAVDHFIDVSNLSNEDVHAIVEKEEIDIAVDLAGYTTGNRWSLFLNRLAPIQVNYLGYPGTLGGDFMDYIIADKILIPEECKKFYSEKVVYLPDSYQPNDSYKEISTRKFSREECGLPETGIVLCCFNNPFKITPDIYRIWMRLLSSVDGSVLWLLSEDRIVIENLKAYATSCGVDEKRIIFAKKMPLSEHLARQKLADLFLDTLPYNAHTTGSEALWSGVPLITIAGEVFASRVGASLLTAYGVPELITFSLPDYERLALKLMNNPHELSSIKSKIDSLRTKSALFDARKYSRNIEAAYLKMFEISCDKKPLQHIVV